MKKALAKFAVGTIGRTLFRIIFKIKFEGKENLPKDGPLLVISNHFTWFEDVHVAGG